MSEIRKVQVILKDLNGIIDACKDLGIDVKESGKDNYILSNHGLKSYSRVFLRSGFDDSYEIVSADARESDLKTLVNKIRSKYTEKMIGNVLSKKGWKVASKEKSGTKTKIKMKLYTSN